MENKPSLYKTEAVHDVRELKDFLSSYGHLWFSIDGEYYFLFPTVEHRYGLCLGEDEWNGNIPRWTFESEAEFASSKMFGGRTFLERQDECFSWDPPYFRELQ